jgi:hypothetical protein
MQVEGAGHKQCKRCWRWFGSQYYLRKHQSNRRKCIAVSGGKPSHAVSRTAIDLNSTHANGMDRSESDDTLSQVTEALDQAEEEIMGGLGSPQQLRTQQLIPELYEVSRLLSERSKGGRAIPWAVADGANGRGSDTSSSSSSNSGDGGNGSGGKEDRLNADSRGMRLGDVANREDEPSGDEVDDSGSLDELFDDFDGLETPSLGSDANSDGQAENEERLARLPRDSPSATGVMQVIVGRANVRWLQAVPKDLTTMRVLVEVLRKVLEKIDDATDPEALFCAWLEFFQLPNEIFAIGRRGGMSCGQRHITNFLSRRVRTWYDTRDRQLEGDALLNADSDQDEEDEQKGQVPPSGHRDGKLNALRRASRFLSRGHLSRAFHALCAESPVIVEEMGLEIIKSHFPSADLDKLHQLNAPPLVTDVQEVQRVIKGCANGGAAGPSQWAPDLFRIMLEDVELCELYGRVLVSLVNKHELMTRELADLFLGAKVIPVWKPSASPRAMSLRPICVSEASLQHLQLVAFRQIPKAFIDNVFKLGDELLQYGVGRSNGVECAFRKIESALLLARDGDVKGVGAMLADVHTAYQHLQRDRILLVLGKYKETKPLYGVANLCFTYAAPRYVRMEDGSVRVLSQSTGGAQGWIIMALAYCLTTLDELKKACVPSLGCALMSASVIDDTNLFGKVDGLVNGYDLLEEALSTNCGLQLNWTKTKVLSPFDEALGEEQLQAWDDRNIEVVSDAKVLGAYMTTDDAELKKLIDTKMGLSSEKGKRVMDMLGDPRLNLQSFILYVTHSVQHMLGYAARLLPPSLAYDMFLEWDKALVELVLRKFGRNEMLEEGHLARWDKRLEMEVSQLLLPVHHGGIGLLPLRMLSLGAWIASVAASAVEILNVMSRPEFVDEDERRPPPPVRYQTEYLQSRNRLIELAPKLLDACHGDGSGVDGVLKLLPPTLLEFLRQCQTYPKTTVKLQSKLMKYVWDAKLEQVKLFHTSSQADLRRINSYTAKVGVAGRIWGILPTQPNLRMTDELMMQALRLQLGAMPAAWMYLVDDAFDCPTCQRKVSVRDIPSHSNHCAANRRTAITGRHDGAGGDLCCAATKSRVPYVWEQVMVDGKKPDITFLFPNQTIVVDVAIVAPEAPSKHGDGEMDPLSAAHDMANAKFKKYDDLSRKSGAVFMPAIFQTSGAYTLETAFLIKRICAAGTDNGMENPMSPAELRDRLAITIQRGNAIANVLTAARLRVKLPAFAKAKPLLAARSFDRGRTARRRSLAWARQVNSAGD